MDKILILYLLCPYDFCDVFSGSIYTEVTGLKPYLVISEYLWLPILTIYVLIKIGDILKIHASRFWSLITGSRA